MKTKILLITLALFLGFGFLGCESETNNNRTPARGDYVISENFLQILGDVKPVTVTPIEDKASPGAVTVFYRGIQGTDYPRSQTLPEIAGEFHVTFNVAAVSGWNAAIDINAGNLSINSGDSGEELYEIAFMELVDLIVAGAFDMIKPLIIMMMPDLEGLPDEELIPYIYQVVFVLVPDWNSLVQVIALAGFEDLPPDATFEDLMHIADVSFFHDPEGNDIVVGTDEITPETVIYSTVPFELIQSVIMGGERHTFTIGELVSEIGFSGTINYPLAFGVFINTLSPGETIENLNIQGLNFYTATGSAMDSDTEITGTDMAIGCNWPLEDTASMF